jgi:3-methylfumaryl-CoA hydratase
MNLTLALSDLGLQESADDYLRYDHALRLARTLNVEDADLAAGSLPLTWIWAFFTPTVPTAGLRIDGHPAARPDGPLADMERRMFVGGELRRLDELRLDTPTRRTSSVIGAEWKQGSTGDFVLVEVEHQYEQERHTVLVERQRLLYRASQGQKVAPVGSPVDLPSFSGARRDLEPDERLLFRYSALTFNTHRIHYDADYARDVEGYPGLVVHGLLTATLLCDVATRQLGAEVATFAFRATSPTFVGVPLAFVCEPPETPNGTSNELNVRAVRGDGITVMTASATSD